MSTPRKTGRKPASPKAAEEVVAEAPEGEAPRKAFVQSLERGLSVLTAFDAEHPTLTLSDVARLTGLDRAAARRFLYTFVDLGYMRVDGRSFSLRTEAPGTGLRLSFFPPPAGDFRAASAQAGG